MESWNQRPDETREQEVEGLKNLAQNFEPSVAENFELDVVVVAAAGDFVTVVAELG